MPVSLILFYRSTNTYALNVIAGAVLSRPSAGLRVLIAPRAQDVINHIRNEKDQGRQVVVAWSFYSTHLRSALHDFETVRTETENVLHMVGGVHASAEPEKMLRAGFDVVFIGEAESSVARLLDHLASGTSYGDVPGVARMIDGVIRHNRPGDAVDLDDFPPFAPTLPRVNPIEITRGCIYACSFCQTPFLFKARFRHRSVEQIAHWARFMNGRGIRDIRFITPTALSYGSSDENVNVGALEELLNNVRTNLKPDARIFFGTFPSEVRPEHVTPPVLALLKKYCDNDNLLMGGQSGSDGMLHRLHRGHNVESIRRAVRYCREAGFRPNVDFIFGLPGETTEDIKASLDLADELSAAGARIHGHTFMPLPGTPLKHAAPGRISPEVEEHLHKLVARGKLYGQWQMQQSLAGKLAE